MMSIEKKAKIYLHREPIDFRLQINGLSLFVQEHMALDPFAEALFVFVNRNRNRIKIIYWEVCQCFHISNWTFCSSIHRMGHRPAQTITA